MTLDYNHMDLYFHMTNHYRKLRNVKPLIDCSIPKGFGKIDKQVKSPKYPRPKVASARSSSPNRRNCPGHLHVPNHSHGLKKHDCLTPVEKSGGRSSSVPLRNSSQDYKYSGRAKSVEPMVKRVPFSKFTTAYKRHDTQKKAKVGRHMNEGGIRKISPVRDQSSPRSRSSKSESRSPSVTPTSAPTPAPRNKGKSAKDHVSGVEEHEYLHFLLRITEDILRNDMYTNSEMQKVFDSHIQANKGRLDVDKMQQQIENLKTELNMPMRKAHRHVSTSLCLCDPSKKELMDVLIQCGCDSSVQVEESQKGLCQCKKSGCLARHTSTQPEIEIKSGYYDSHAEDASNDPGKTPGNGGIANAAVGDGTANSAVDDGTAGPPVEVLMVTNEKFDRGSDSAMQIADLLLQCPTTMECPARKAVQEVKSSAVNEEPSAEDGQPASEDGQPATEDGQPATEKLVPESHEQITEVRAIPEHAALVPKDPELAKEKTEPVAENLQLVMQSESQSEMHVLKPITGSWKTPRNEKANTENETNSNLLQSESSLSAFGLVKELSGLENLEPANKEAGEKPEEGLPTTDTSTSQKDIGGGEAPETVAEPISQTQQPVLKTVSDGLSMKEKISFADSAKFACEKTPQAIFDKKSSALCHCNVSFRKLALKIQLDETDKNEPYVLVEGPVCIPKTLLETKGVPVLLENMSSMLLESEAKLGVMHKPNSFSDINLLHETVTPPRYDNDVVSVSAVIEAPPIDNTDVVGVSAVIEPPPIDNTKLLQNDYDLTPQRDVPESNQESNQYHFLLIDASTSISSGTEIALETAQEKSYNEILPAKQGKAMESDVWDFQGSQQVLPVLKTFQARRSIVNAGRDVRSDQQLVKSFLKAPGDKKQTSDLATKTSRNPSVAPKPPEVKSSTTDVLKEILSSRQGQSVRKIPEGKLLLNEDYRLSSTTDSAGNHIRHLESSSYQEIERKRTSGEEEEPNKIFSFTLRKSDPSLLEQRDLSQQSYLSIKGTEDFLAKLDELPSLNMTKSQEKQVAEVTEKLQKFRTTAEEEDTTFRQFPYKAMPEKVSLVSDVTRSETSQDLISNSLHIPRQESAIATPGCCGLVKSKRPLSAASSTTSSMYRN